jgi:gallidermin/nisin family lantibiotic
VPTNNELARDLDILDLDIEVGTEEAAAGPMVTSWSICTPGCTSPGGGSACSYCC